MIIGITGTPGAGKGAVVDYFVRQEGFRHISARAIWTRELKNRGIEVNRDTMTELANQLRAEHGPAYFVERALEEIVADESVVIESIRTVGEAKLLKEKGGVLLGVEAGRELRYERIHNRGTALDDVSFVDFVRQEENEMNNEDPNRQNIANVMSMADYTLTNNGTLEELHEQIETFLEKFQFAS